MWSGVGGGVGEGESLEWKEGEECGEGGECKVGEGGGG